MSPMACDVYFKNDAVFVLSWAALGRGRLGRNLREPIIRLDPKPTASELGRAVLLALEPTAPQTLGSSGNSHASERSIAEILRAAGAGSWSRLTCSSRQLSVENKRNRVTILGMDGEAGACKRDPEEIGRRLLEMLETCSHSDPLAPPRVGSSFRTQRPESSRDGGTPQAFGYKTSWIVVDSTEAAAVASALGLKDPREASWDVNPYDPDGVFVSPSVLGWTFVLGYLIEPHFEAFIPWIESLSRRFGEAQYFATHRVVGLQAWVKAAEGRIVRGYDWLGERGEVVMDVGGLTPEEEELGLSRLINHRTVDGDWEDVHIPDEDDVMNIAGRWSINPQQLDAYDSEGPGYIGHRP
ncbi:hypothetical protein [Singulisphaera sp. PoT]|uniref:hypothetical protein n=1 Tax=Singulisphaera sp. PoT TaxID=3411797 RepID=UPI003BF552A6